MPRYFFNVHDGTDIPDNGGFELPGEEEARLEAVRLAGTLIRDGARAFWINRKWSLDVRDSVGDFQFTLDFKATLKKPQGWTINLHGQE